MELLLLEAWQMSCDQLSKNFKKSEFKCRDGSEVPDELMDNLKDLVENLQIIRDEFTWTKTISNLENILD